MNAFTLLGDSGSVHGNSFGQDVRVRMHLFDILNQQSSIQHPLCEECTDKLLDMLDHQLQLTEQEANDFERYYEDLTRQEVDAEASAEQDDELRKLEEDEEQLKQQLASLENERSHVREQVAREQQRSRELDEEERKYCEQYNQYKRQMLETEDAEMSVRNQLDYAREQLTRLRKTNVFNATFHIWHSGYFGTINGFRLGRLPNDPVDWNEINAAWGQTVLLLHSLANKINLKFDRYRLVPYGNYSYIESLSDKTKELPLYGSGGIKFLWESKFDSAMVAFLDCLQQFEAKERNRKGFSLPYKMEKGRLEDMSTGASFSIKTQFNSEEQWTKALKFMLTNLKWMLAWVST